MMLLVVIKIYFTYLIAILLKGIRCSLQLFSKYFKDLLKKIKQVQYFVTLSTGI